MVKGQGPRPVRFLIEQLGLDDAQASAVSKAFDGLRLEREQAALDRKRARSAIADLVQADVLDKAALGKVGLPQVEGATREKAALEGLVKQLHAVLSPEQRLKLSTLLRSRPFSL